MFKGGWSNWRGSSASSVIENLVAKGDECSIEEVLDQDDLLDDCKNQSANLVKWISDRKRVKQLIDLITVMPEEDEHKRGHKYPFVVYEIFNSEVQEIINVFFKSVA